MEIRESLSPESNAILASEPIVCEPEDSIELNEDHTSDLVGGCLHRLEFNRDNVELPVEVGTANCVNIKLDRRSNKFKSSRHENCHQEKMSLRRAALSRGEFPLGYESYQSASEMSNCASERV